MGSAVLEKHRREHLTTGDGRPRTHGDPGPMDSTAGASGVKCEGGCTPPQVVCIADFKWLSLPGHLSEAWEVEEAIGVVGKTTGHSLSTASWADWTDTSWKKWQNMRNVGAKCQGGTPCMVHLH